ncbi:MAG: hypothetical protein ACXWV7_09855, partial [Nitrospira sp.]
MRHDQAVALLGTVVLCIGLANCTTTEPTPADRAKVTAAVMEVPVIPDAPPVGHEPPPSESSGEVQEHGVKQVMPGLIVPDTAVLGGLSLPLTS